MALIIALKKDNKILDDFQDEKNFGGMQCAALFQQDDNYYAVLISNCEDDSTYESLLQLWNQYILNSTISDIHSAAVTPQRDKTYQYSLRKFPVLGSTAVSAFYAKHTSDELSAFVMAHSKRCMDFDFLDLGTDSLFVFVKNDPAITSTSLPPLDACEGAERYREFIDDLNDLVAHRLGAATELQFVQCVDHQKAAVLSNATITDSMRAMNLFKPKVVASDLTNKIEETVKSCSKRSLD